jgi:hypothetical protein
MRNLRRGDGSARRVAAASWPIRASQCRGSDPSCSPPCVRFCCIGHIACSVDACRSYHIPDADLNRRLSCSGGLTDPIRRTPASSSLGLRLCAPCWAKPRSINSGVVDVQSTYRIDPTVKISVRVRKPRRELLKPGRTPMPSGHPSWQFNRAGDHQIGLGPVKVPSAFAK